MVVCAPVTPEGMIDPRWGRADDMVRMPDTMALPLHPGAAGDARAPVSAVGRDL